MKRKPQRNEAEYTPYERERYLYRTAAEMRAIIDKIDARRTAQTTDVDDSIERSVDSGED